MIWQDIIVRRPLGDRALVGGMAAAFGINPHEVLILRRASVFPEPGGAKVVCVVSERVEGFRIALSVYTYSGELNGIDPVAVVKRFASVAQTECLMTDESPDPYTMLSVHPTGECVSVKLDVDRLDAKDEYHISG